MSVSIQESVAEELQLIQQLNDVLEQEQTHLLADDLESLQLNTQNKSQLVSKLTMANQKRLNLLTKHGLPKQETSMSIWLEKSADTESKSLWQQLLDNTNKAKELNQTNGLLLNRLSARTQNALAVLQGQSPASASLYSRDGQNSTSTASRTIIS
jgi:flagellar biosynthesis/type III secretory pathway chaperone